MNSIGYQSNSGYGSPIYLFGILGNTCSAQDLLLALTSGSLLEGPKDHMGMLGIKSELAKHLTNALAAVLLLQSLYQLISKALCLKSKVKGYLITKVKQPVNYNSQTPPFWRVCFAKGLCLALSGLTFGGAWG